MMMRMATYALRTTLLCYFSLTIKQVVIGQYTMAMCTLSLPFATVPSVQSGLSICKKKVAQRHASGLHLS